MGTVVTAGLGPALREAVCTRLGTPALDVVVASAGRQPGGRFLELDQAEWAAAIAGAARAFREAQAVAARLVADGKPGRIVFLVSTASVRPLAGAALEATVGGFLTTIGLVGAAELGGAGVTVNVVAHGWLEGEDDDAFTAGVPIGRLARPADLAEAVAFLASEAAGYVNGATLAVDGGFWITKTAGGSPLLAG